MTETPSTPDSKVRVPLSRAVPAHGEDVLELVFREPRGADIARCGNPVKINFAAEPPDLSFDEAKMSRMMSALASVPESTIGLLTASDWMNCAWQVAGFFVPSDPTSSTTATA